MTHITPERLENIKRTLSDELERAYKMGCHIQLDKEPLGKFNFREGYKKYLNKTGKRIITITIEG